MVGPLKMSSSKQGRDGAAVRIPPPLVALVVIGLGYALERWAPLVDLPLPDAVRYGVGGALVVLSVLALGLWPILLFARSGQNPEPWTTTPQIIEAGPYRLTRNPMYLTMCIVCFALGLVLASAWLLLLTPVLALALYLVAIRHEEAYLEAKFGEPYRDYKRRVRRWL